MKGVTDSLDFETIMTIERKGKRIVFYLEDGVHFTVDNLVDVDVYEIPEGATDYLPTPTKLVEKQPI